jgi:hypothetical protein
MSEHIILVALVVEAKTREEANEKILEDLEHQLTPGKFYAKKWWIAEDDRPDDSDDGSAVFVLPGTQAPASQLLHLHGYSSVGSVIYDQPVPQNRRRKNKFI